MARVVLVKSQELPLGSPTKMQWPKALGHLLLLFYAISKELDWK